MRRLLLEAVTGFEDKVICFCQDAIHLASASANLTIGEGLGEWKQQRFASGLYVSPGIYTLHEYDEQLQPKIAARGSNLNLNFERIAAELSERQVSAIERSFFVGYVLSRQQMVRYGKTYLKEVEERLDLIPSRLRARNYLSDFNWQTENRDSTINTAYSGSASARYIPSDLSQDIFMS